jgi:hypothetical protein
LQRGLRVAAQELAPYVDVLFLGYGLCGSAFVNARTVLDVDLPVFVPMDHDHPVDDCVAMCLGGRERYQQELAKQPGTFFMTPGWSYHWRQFFANGAVSATSDIVRRVFSHYTRTLLIGTPAMHESEVLRNSREFSDAIGLQTETCSGTIEPLAVAWNAAKESVMTQKHGHKSRGSQSCV